MAEDLQDFGRGFASIHATLGEDLQGFVRLWERICKKIRESLEEDSQGFVRLWERICKGCMRLWERICKDS